MPKRSATGERRDDGVPVQRVPEPGAGDGAPGRAATLEVEIEQPARHVTRTQHGCRPAALAVLDQKKDRGIYRDLPGFPGISRDATLGGANDLHGSGDSIGPCPRSPDPRSAVRGRVSRKRPPRTTRPGLRDDLRDTARDLASAASRFPGAFPVTAESARNTTRKTAVSPEQTRSASTHATGWRGPLREL